MNLVEVKNVDSVFYCLMCSVTCGKVWHSRNSTPVFADLDGEPYVAYYCKECAGSMVSHAIPSTED